MRKCLEKAINTLRYYNLMRNIDAGLTLCNKVLNYLETEIKFLYIDHGER